MKPVPFLEADIQEIKYPARLLCNNDYVEVRTQGELMVALEAMNVVLFAGRGAELMIDWSEHSVPSSRRRLARLAAFGLIAAVAALLTAYLA